MLATLRIPSPRGRSRCRPRKLAGDKAYSVPRIRCWLRRRRIEAVIPQKNDERARHRGRPFKFDRQAYRQRNAVERCVGWLKESRRLAIRYDKLARNYLAMVHLVMIRRYLTTDFSDRA